MSHLYGITGGPPVIEPDRFQRGGRPGDEIVINGYVVAREVDYRDDKRLTCQWLVVSRSSKAVLGLITWHSPWRCYVLEPRPQVLFNSECMLDIARFMDENRRTRRKDTA